MDVQITNVGGGRKIAAIKAVRACSGLGLKEAKAVVDNADSSGQCLVTIPDNLERLQEDLEGTGYQATQVNVTESKIEPIPTEAQKALAAIKEDSRALLELAFPPLQMFILPVERGRQSPLISEHIVTISIENRFS